MTTVDLKRARELAEMMNRCGCQGIHQHEAASLLRALCDRCEQAERIMRECEWKFIDMNTNECPSCSRNEDRGHADDCKLAAWLGGGKA